MERLRGWFRRSWTRWCWWVRSVGRRLRQLWGSSPDATEDDGMPPWSRSEERLPSSSALRPAAAALLHSYELQSYELQSYELQSYELYQEPSPPRQVIVSVKDAVVDVDAKLTKAQTNDSDSDSDSYVLLS